MNLREKRASAVEQARAVMNVAETESRAMNADEMQQFQGFMDEADTLKKQIDAADRLQAEERALEVSAGRKTTETRTFDSANTELRSYLLGTHNAGPQGMTYELRAQSVGTAAAGGHTVADEPMHALEVALKSFGGMRDVSRIIRTTTGADLPYPTLNDTSNVGSIVGENTSLGDGPDLSFGQVIFKGWKYSSGAVLVPWELIQDASINVGEVVGSALGERLARIQNTHFTIGDNSGKPQGVVDGAADSGVVTGTLGEVSYDELTDALFASDASYRRNGRWMFNSRTLAAIRKVKDDAGRPLFYGESDSIAAGHPATLLGKPYTVNEDMPDLDTADAKAILFGDFSKYIIRDVAAVNILRLSERYADTGQVAFLGFMRCDGRMVDAGTSPVQFIANAAA